VWLLLFACASEPPSAAKRASPAGEDPVATTPEEETPSASVELAGADRCLDPCTFTSAAAGVARVRYEADGWVLGWGEGPDHALTWDFSTLGERRVAAIGEGEGGTELARDEATVEVYANTVALLAPEACDNPCTFSAEATGDVASLRYEADGWVLGEVPVGTPELTYTFSELGDREVRVVGLDASGAELAEHGRIVTVGSPLPEVPYFYQYANDLYPSSTCQNTSVAMVLASYGWGGEPDDLTAEWGKDYAQSVSGLAALFNAEASRAGLGARLVGHSDGDLADVDALLDRGLPVIVHGYFTRYGHVLVLLGHDDGGYWVNARAGTWDQRFGGGYDGGGEPTAGGGIYYPKAGVGAATATWDGRTPAPIWYHELQ